MIYLTALILLALVAASLIAWLILPKADRLPMNWGLSGRPTWTAPRVMALTFTPALALVTTGVILLIAPGDVGFAAVVALAFLAAHLVHLWLIRRQLGGDRS